MSNIIRPNNFSTENLSVSPIQKNRQGSNQVHLNYKYNEDEYCKLAIQTPRMLAPFGISEFQTEYGPKFSLDTSFGSINDDPKVKQFYDMMVSLDEYMIETAVNHSKEWFGKSLTKDIISEFYRPIIKKGKQKKNSEECYPDMIKFKIRTIDGIKNVESYDSNKNKVDIDDYLKQGSKVRAILEVAPVWFVNKNFGISLNLTIVEILKPEKITGFSFEEDSDEEYEEHF